MMNTSAQLAKHITEVFFGGNWSTSDLSSQLKEVSCKQANTKIDGCNTILSLVYHINYYLEVVTKVLEGGPLVGKDSESFDHPAISSEEEWKKLVDRTLNNGRIFSERISAIDPKTLWSDFTDPKYGNYFRNILGVIEHTHYHLGQIVMVKKIILSKCNNLD